MPPVSTFDLLLSLGFVRDDRVISDDPGGLSFDFGNLHLQASHVVSPRSGYVVLFTGVGNEPRCISAVDFEMPREVDSLELGTAFITWFLDKQAGGRFESVKPAPWLQVGREHRNLLPWEKRRIAYENAPRCVVRRDFARVALRHLSEMIATASDEVSVAFTFDGEVLSIRVGPSVTAMPACGTKWATCFTVGAGSLRQLPRRLMHDPVQISVWNNTITIGNRVYAGRMASTIREDT